MGAIKFGSKRDFVPLQCADLFVYESYKHLSNRLQQPERDVRKSWLKLSEKTRLHGGYFDRAGLEAVVAKMKEIQRQEIYRPEV